MHNVHRLVRAICLGLVVTIGWASTHGLASTPNAGLEAFAQATSVPVTTLGQDLDAGTVGCGTKALGPESGKVCRLLKAAGRVEEDKRTSLTA